MSRTRIALLVLLIVEGIGGIVFAALTAIIGESITPGFIPWQFALTPALFGLACLVVASIYWRGHPAGPLMAAALQALVIVGAVSGLISSAEPALWIALAMGLGGVLLLTIGGPRR
jgi:hypothetical protein